MNEGKPSQSKSEQLDCALGDVARPRRRNEVRHWAIVLLEASHQASNVAAVRKRRTDAKNARKDLTSVTKFASVLKDRLDALPRDAVRALHEEWWAIAENEVEASPGEPVVGGAEALELMAVHLKRLTLAAERAEQVLAMEWMPKGRRDVRAFDVGYAAAGAYFRLSGREPGRSVSVENSTSAEGKEGGDFLNLLRRIYDALGITADPVRQARNICKHWRDPQNV